MKLVLNSPIVGGEENAPYSAAVMRTLAWVTELVPGLDQWRCILEEYEGSELVWKLDVSPEAGRGHECAEKKIATLNRFPEITNTGELKDWELSDAENIAKLKEQTGKDLVHWYGGIRLHCSDADLTSGDMEICETELLIAFSGAREDFDAFVAVAVAKGIEAAFEKHNPNVYSQGSWKALEEDPVTGFALKVLR